MIKEEYWLCNDGKTKPISELTEEHVKNILRKLIREDVDEATITVNIYNSLCGEKIHHVKLSF